MAAITHPFSNIERSKIFTKLEKIPQQQSRVVIFGKTLLLGGNISAVY
jgi:hypothetical protein